jgi:hypothetical protein
MTLVSSNAGGWWPGGGRFRAANDLGGPQIDTELERKAQREVRKGTGILSVAKMLHLGTGTVQRIKREMASKAILDCCAQALRPALIRSYAAAQCGRGRRASNPASRASPRAAVSPPICDSLCRFRRFFSTDDTRPFPWLIRLRRNRDGLENPGQFRYGSAR